MQLDLDACFENEISYAYINNNKKDTYDQIDILINKFNNNIRSSAEQGYVLLNIGKSFYVNYQGINMNVNIKQSYLTLSDLALLDIINNNPTKKIHFASSYNLKNYGWNNNYKQRMIGCELTPSMTATIGIYDTISKKLIENNINNINVGHFKKLESSGNCIKCQGTAYEERYLLIVTIGDPTATVEGTVYHEAAKECLKGIKND